MVKTNLFGRMRFEYLDVDKIATSGYNANVMDDRGFDRLVREIKEVGFVAPIIVRQVDDYYIVVDGEHRLKAAKVLNYEKVPAVVVDIENEELAKLISIRLNVLRGKIDPIKFIKYYDEYVSRYGVEAVQEVIGFTDEIAWKHLKNEVLKILDTSKLPADAVKKAKSRVKKAKTVEQISQILTKVYENYGSLEDKNILVFSFGGVEAIYFLVDKDVFEEIRKFSRYVQDNGIEVNGALMRVFADWEDMIKDLEQSEPF